MVHSSPLYLRAKFHAPAASYQLVFHRLFHSSLPLPPTPSPHSCIRFSLQSAFCYIPRLTLPSLLLSEACHLSPTPSLTLNPFLWDPLAFQLLQVPVTPCTNVLFSPVLILCYPQFFSFKKSKSNVGQFQKKKNNTK